MELVFVFEKIASNDWWAAMHDVESVEAGLQKIGRGYGTKLRLVIPKEEAIALGLVRGYNVGLFLTGDEKKAVLAHLEFMKLDPSVRRDKEHIPQKVAYRDDFFKDEWTVTDEDGKKHEFVVVSNPGDAPTRAPAHALQRVWGE